MSVLSYQPPGYVARPGQDIVGYDFECPGSVLPGMCALPSGLGGVLVCSRTPQCQAVVVLPKGGWAVGGPWLRQAVAGDVCNVHLVHARPTRRSRLPAQAWTAAPQRSGC